jgi:hypothetical protein
MVQAMRDLHGQARGQHAAHAESSARRMHANRMALHTHGRRTNQGRTLTRRVGGWIDDLWTCVGPRTGSSSHQGVASDPSTPFLLEVRSSFLPSTRHSPPAVAAVPAIHRARICASPLRGECRATGTRSIPRSRPSASTAFEPLLLARARHQGLQASQRTVDRSGKEQWRQARGLPSPDRMQRRSLARLPHASSTHGSTDRCRGLHAHAAGAGHRPVSGGRVWWGRMRMAPARLSQHRTARTASTHARTHARTHTHTRPNHAHAAHTLLPLTRC